MSVMNGKMKATWRKMAGIALIWVALAALIYLSSSNGGFRAAIAACMGFLSFASGFSLFMDGLKRDIVDQLQRTRNDPAT